MRDSRATQLEVIEADADGFLGSMERVDDGAATVVDGWDSAVLAAAAASVSFAKRHETVVRSVSVALRASQAPMEKVMVSLSVEASATRAVMFLLTPCTTTYSPQCDDGVTNGAGKNSAGRPTTSSESCE